MIHSHDFPIIEIDDNPVALIEPSEYLKPIVISPHCVICFFSEVVEEIAKDNAVRMVWQQKWEFGYHTIYELEYQGKMVAFYHTAVGSPAAAALLEESIALGCRKFIVVGGAGIIGKQHPVGHLLIPESAVRDEGTSYHYLPPSREVHASAEAVSAIEAVIRDHRIDYTLTKTWTTDAPYRETRDMVTRRCREGCLTVEMEAAALFAVAKFRNVSLGQILYAGDDLTSERWDMRDGQSRANVRRDLFWLAAEACLKL